MPAPPSLPVQSANGTDRLMHDKCNERSPITSLDVQNASSHHQSTPTVHEQVTERTLSKSVVALDVTRSPASRSRGGTTTPSKLIRRRKTTSTMTLGENHFPVVAAVVKSKRFEIAMGIVIIINCATMGLEAELLLGKAQNVEKYVQISEHLITFIFLAELLLRVMVYGWRSFAPLPKSLWNFLDALLVIVTGIIPVWVLPLMGLPNATDSLQTLTVLRALRLARLVRVVQKFEAFHEVWLLLRGLMESGRVLIWTVVVIFFITYLFAVFGVVLLGVQIKEEYDNVRSMEGDSVELEELVAVTDGVLPLMYTLIQVLTLDSWNSIARPMMKYVSWSWAFFYLYIAIAVIVMMNLVTAVIVENALKNSQKDANAVLKEKEKQKQVELARFRRVFAEMDVDGDGELSWPEFESAFDDKGLSAQLRLLGIEPDNCREIFNMLDDGDGVLSVREFFNGLSCMEGTANAKDLLRTNKTVDLLVKLLCQQNQELREDMDELLKCTPGAHLHLRKGTFKSRARRQQSTVDVFHTCVGSGSDSDSVNGSPSIIARKAKSCSNEEQTRISNARSNRHQLTETAYEPGQEFQQAFATCNDRLEACNQQSFTLSSADGRLNQLEAATIQPLTNYMQRSTEERNPEKENAVPTSASRWRSAMQKRCHASVEMPPV